MALLARTGERFKIHHPPQEAQMADDRTTLTDDEIRTGGPRAEALEDDDGTDDSDGTDGDDDGTDDFDGTDSDADGDDAS
jgi:hypothetical protein